MTLSCERDVGKMLTCISALTQILILLLIYISNLFSSGKHLSLVLEKRTHNDAETRGTNSLIWA